jgi:cytochrome-b5 reductase
MSDSASKFTSSAFINGIYIPSGLLIFGCFIVKSEWLPYAIALSAALAGWKIFSSCESKLPLGPQRDIRDKQLLTYGAVPKAVLRPDALQEFELKEKTIISHNVAM